MYILYITYIKTLDKSYMCFSCMTYDRCYYNHVTIHDKNSLYLLLCISIYDCLFY